MLESNKHLFTQLAKDSILPELDGFTNAVCKHLGVLLDGFQ